MLFVPPSIPFMVPEAEAAVDTEAGCLDAASLLPERAAYTVVTCANPFNVTVEIGQRLDILKAHGGTDSMFPSAAYGGTPGVYQYSAGGITGTITIVNPSMNAGFNNISFVMDGSSRIVSFEMLTLPSSVNSVKLYTIFVDSSGSYVTAGHDTLNNVSPGQQFSLTHGGSTANLDFNLYVTQAWDNNNNPLVNVAVFPAPADTTPPVITLDWQWQMSGDTSENITRQATNSTGYNVKFTVEVNDAFSFEEAINDHSYGITCSSPYHGVYSSGLFYSLRTVYTNHLFPVGVTTITCTATDEAGNVGTMSFTVTINLEAPVDTTPPVITLVCCAMSGDTNQNITRQATNSTGYNVNFAVVANDAGDGWSNDSSQISCSPAANSLFPVGVTTITCTATDEAGNVGTMSFTVTINLEGSADTTPPLVEVTGDGSAGIPGVPIICQVCDPFVDATNMVIYTTDYDVISGVDPHTITFAALASDPDQIPGITDHYNAGFVHPHCQTEDRYGVGAPTAIEFMGLGYPSLHLIPSHSVVYYTANLYFWDQTATITCYAQDVAGNEGSVSFTVTVILGAPPVDTTPPVLTLMFLSSGDTTENITRQATNSTGQNVTFTVWATDDVLMANGNTSEGWADCRLAGGSGINNAHGYLFPIGVTTVTCSNDDAAGNIGTLSFTVTVVLEGAAAQAAADAAAAEAAAAEAAAEAAAAEAAAAIAALEAEQAAADAAAAQAAAEASLAAADVAWVEANPGMVKNAVGSSTPGCEDTNSCFIPSTIAISTGDTVTWVNTDNAAHTVTSGTPASGLSGVFDSSLMMAGSVSFSHTFDTAGTYPYHCMVHPWMLGTVIVTGAAVEEEIVIPSWIKSNAGWWDAGLIDDRNYVTGLQWLISNGIMTIPSTEQGTGSDDVIPSWVKNNARWWADGSIDDRNYVTGLQWLITNGVMTIG